MRPFPTACAAAAIVTLAAGSADAQREHTRPVPNRSTTVTESQAAELTLTLTEVAVRAIQVWIRTAGAIDDARTTITADLSANEAARLKVGQRARAFSPESRSRMHQAFVSEIVRRGDRAIVKAALQGVPRETGRYYVLEIVTEEGDFLSVPNEAIIASGDTRTVYVKEADGGYVPREFTPGVQGELYTHVVDGLRPGEQVVTFGSFFIDADHKLKGS
jgi:hypothetical protein